MLTTSTIKDALQVDPADRVKGQPSARIIKRITTASATQTIGTVPANSIITAARVARLTKWNQAPTTFEIGKGGDTDWLMTTSQANVSGNITEGEAGDVESVGLGKIVTAATDIVVTLSHNSATAGVAWVIVEFSELVQP